jgi:hypothetical protein
MNLNQEWLQANLPYSITEISSWAGEKLLGIKKRAPKWQKFLP